ncbi:MULTISPECIES: bifunctional phosphopantothenoylcysteine decarboxylase/phosphopantothenate--cysteine ligase CoaBC [unclassified Ruminococcus]|uniref:bifunctional phosphopantothenoylcysteine decarboxylase/phosphopantothenate--cysteine ligase CoaBC n=1 Tax=unclassified Ruminococcus TaxID=2608920 RepID=UPI00210A96AB|nr:MULTISPECIES: bifunctional phosphopantothenoylcysteine decarboxylase/phosphopantothenate--cysteine ligase CoaBC [unclassified Ruminococcus]MCQ4022083.1 bifunctional phosphopantothenoylcysteine decarboxylase/phosphopantothenate--cysteine ligase CoaBC [Ruminococcus sp. zg-924]MCQ4114403.1 bifunctional phosphopantothenoylcysteine decarboxylase/phosphopantothenate--cysteine ligase CoaBC [Ruminococcus sp. zg-921]
MFKNKTVILGVSGGIAAYKIPNLARLLIKQGCDVHVIMTENATKFITEDTFEALTSNKCIVDTFDRNHPFEIKHISLATKADYMLIAPATANVIGKIANGIADDMLTTTVMACKCPVAIAPAMNTNMYQNAIVQDNIEKLKKFGYTIIEPNSGILACRTVGAGKMPEPQELYSYVERELACDKDLKGLKLLVTAGPTIEPIDPVRYITNHSSGKMGYAIAKAAMLRGAEVTLVSGKCALEPVPFVETVNVTTAEDMFTAVTSKASEQDIIVKAAAVADYTPQSVSDQKIKKSDSDMSIALKRTKDILKYIGEHKRDGQVICGFAMETENMLENARKKLKAKNIDIIAANNVKVAGAGFEKDTNVLTLITSDGETQLELMSKFECANKLLDEIIKIKTNK